MQFLQLISSLFWIFIIIYILVSRKSFNYPESSLSKGQSVFIFVVSILIFFINIYVFGVAYFKAYNPNYEYEKISKSVDFHIYQPTFLPQGIEQSTKFYIDNKEFMGNPNSVRSAYDIPLSATAKGSKSNVIVISQTKVDPSFDIKSNLNSNNSSSVQLITLSNFPGKAAYLKTSSFVKTIVVVDENNVLVSLTSPHETTENLLAIAESLK